jgi:hypothetical protein
MGRQIIVKVINSLKIVAICTPCNVYNALVQLGLGSGDIQEC